LFVLVQIEQELPKYYSVENNMFRLDKRKIFLLYQYYLLGAAQKTKEESKKEKERII